MCVEKFWCWPGKNGSRKLKQKGGPFGKNWHPLPPRHATELAPSQSIHSTCMSHDTSQQKQNH